MPRVSKRKTQSQSVVVPTATEATPARAQLTIPLDDGTAMLAMIQALIPLGLTAVEDARQQEVLAVAGVRSAHDDAHPHLARWGSQPGSISRAEQKLPITVPRVRDRVARHEGPLATYQTFPTPRALDVGLFRRVLGGLSCRDDEAAAETVPEAFGLARSSVSRRFITARARPVETLQARRLDDREWLVLFLDGKSFARDPLVIAVGGTRPGEKRIPGLVQTASEHRRVCAAFLRELVERGFTTPRGLLVVLDGATGLRAAVREVVGDDVPVQRCQWHKREHVVSYLPKRAHLAWRRQLQAAYAHPLYADAKRALQHLGRELTRVNVSAARSLEAGLEDTLTLHRLTVYPELGLSFKTTNLIETIMARVEATTLRVDRWRTSDQKLRWCAAALLAIEPHLRRVKNYQELPLLEQALAGTIIPASHVAA